jgi:hypothetical protein
MNIRSVGPPGSPPVEIRQRTTREPAESSEPARAPPAESARPARPLDPVSDGLKSLVLQTQETGTDPGAASNETLTQLFGTLVDLLAKAPAPSTKLDV